MVRFIHTADVHYGVENYGRIDPKTGIHSRLLDFHQAFNVAIDHAITEQVDFFVFAGDAYKTAHPTPTQQRLLMESFLRLYHAKIPVVIVVGNHDNALSFGKAHALEIFGQLPLDGFHVIAKPAAFILATKSGPCNIVGLPWPSRATIALQSSNTYATTHHISEQLSTKVSQILTSLIATLNPDLPAVLVGHLTVATGVFSGSEKRAIYGSDPLFMISDLARPPFDYVALGHLHRYQNLNPQGYPAVVYSGSLERVDFGERKEEKGFCLVDIPRKYEAQHRFIPIPTRKFIQLEIMLPEEPELHTDTILDKLRTVDLSETVVKILYRVPPGTRDGVNTAAIQQACNSAHYLVGIIPLRTTQQPVMQRRAREIIPATQAPQDLATLLTHYIASKPELAPHKDALLSTAQQLVEESLSTNHTTSD